jgi:hypothetical protein
MKRFLIFLGICFFLVFSGVVSAQADRGGEVAALLSRLDSSSRTERINTAKNITQLGISDPSLYERVAGLLKDGYASAVESSHVDEMAWLCKALAASGDTKYQALLQEVATQAPSSKLQKYANQSIDLFAKYQERSRILNATADWDASLNAEENRLVSMLNSENSELRRDAAKTIVRNSRQVEKVYDSVATALTEMLNSGALDKLSVDTMAWLCKAIAASGNSKYAATLEQVVGGTKSQKLIKFASKALQDLK